MQYDVKYFPTLDELSCEGRFSLIDNLGDVSEENEFAIYRSLFILNSYNAKEFRNIYINKFNSKIETILREAYLYYKTICEEDAKKLLVNFKPLSKKFFGTTYKVKFIGNCKFLKKDSEPTFDTKKGSKILRKIEVNNKKLNKLETEYYYDLVYRLNANQENLEDYQKVYSAYYTIGKWDRYDRIKVIKLGDYNEQFKLDNLNFVSSATAQEKENLINNLYYVYMAIRTARILQMISFILYDYNKFEEFKDYEPQKADGLVFNIYKELERKVIQKRQ